MTAPGYPLAAAVMALFTGAFVAIVAMSRRGLGARAPVALVVPVVWTGVEFFRGPLVFTGYPWFLAAHPLVEAPVLAAPAAWLGTYFVSFLVAAVAGAVVCLTGGTAQGRRLAVGLLAVVAGVWGAGVLAFRGSEPPAPAATARIALVQTNLPQSNKLGWSIEQRLADFDRFAALTREAAAADPKPDLIVWPETMFPGDALNPEAVAAAARAGLYWPGPGGTRIPMTHFADELADLQRDIGVPLLIGAIAVDGLMASAGADGRVALDFRARYNSTFIVSGGTVRAERYDKMHLTPFGEVIPYVWRWPAVQRVLLNVGAGGMSFNLSHGRGPKVFTLELPRGGDDATSPAPAALRFATPICFEATMPAVCRSLAYDNGRPAVDLLINMSNDGWFGPYAGGRRQHLQVARWRAVELGVPMLRAVNTGISAAIDRRGRLLAAGPAGQDAMVDVDGVLIAEVPLNVGGQERAGTLYGRTGDWFGWLTLALTALLTLAAGATGRSRRRAAANAEAAPKVEGGDPALPDAR